MSLQCCNTKSLCVDPANPVQNFSAEAPDLTLFIGQNTGWDNSDGGYNTPSIGGTWSDSGCLGTCLSTISQADADQCAANQQLACADNSWQTPPGTPVVNAFNQQESCQSLCPDGLPFTFTVPAGQFISTNQARANEIAQTFACREARLHRLCLSALNPTTGTEGQLYTGTIVASGSFVDANNNIWSIISGALPNGITAPSIAGPTLTLSGKPTQIGTFNFTMQITTPNGDFMQKNYTITVIGGPPLPTLYWPMDLVVNPGVCGVGSADLFDVEQSIRLSSSGGVPTNVPGKISTAVHFGALGTSLEVTDPTCSVFGTNFLAYNGGGFSASMWVRFQAPIHAPYHAFFKLFSSPVLFQSTPFVAISLRYDTSNNLIYNIFVTPSGGPTGNFGTVPLNTWVFITMVYNPVTNQITFMTNNANPVSAVFTTAMPNFPTGTVYFGPDVGGDLTQWDVDEVGVWIGYQFSADNTAFLYNNGNGQRPAFS